MLSASTFIVLRKTPFSLELYHNTRKRWKGSAVDIPPELKLSLALPAIQPEITPYSAIFGSRAGTSERSVFYPSLPDSLVAVEFCASRSSANDPACLRHGYALIFHRQMLFDIVGQDLSKGSPRTVEYNWSIEPDYIPWHYWGPQCTRLLPAPSSVYGTRYARRFNDDTPGSGATKCRVEVCDFNPYAVRRFSFLKSLLPNNLKMENSFCPKQRTLSAGWILSTKFETGQYVNPERI